jgi:hypothetical protein
MRFSSRSGHAAFAILAAAPACASAATITSFSPTLGPIGTHVTITGTAFTGATHVSFAGVTAAYTVKSATQIVATLPGAATGPIAVTTSAGTVTSSANFNVTPRALAAPATMHPAGTVSVTASGMDAYTSMDVYFDTTDVALAVSNGSGVATISVPVPANALPGAHWITFDERSTHKAAQTALTVNTDWLQAAYGPAIAGYNPYEGTLDSNSVTTLDTSWAGYDGGYSNATPLVEYQGTIFAGDVNGVVRAYNASTGALNWTANPGGWLAQRTPVVYGTSVYFSNATNIFAYKVNCGAHGATCTPVWTQTLSVSQGGGLSLYKGSLYATGTDGNVYPVNPATGALGTPFYAYNNTSGEIITPVSFSPDGSYAYATSSGILQVAFSSGGRLEASNSYYFSPVAFTGGIGFYETGDGAVHEIGGVGWSATLNGTYCYATPAVAYGEVFAGDCNNVSAFNAADGGLDWVASGLGFVSGIAVANHVVYACADFSVVALDANYGEPLWTGAQCSGAPIVANGSVYSAAGQIYAFTIPALASSSVHRAPSLWQLKPDARLVAVRTPDR